MELRQLRYFLAVADTRSFVSAAEKLYISRQAISKSVAQLEEELNVELFMRESSGAFLTPAGVMFYERVRTIVMELSSIRNQMRSYGTRYQQRIRIACTIGVVSLLEQKLLNYRETQTNAEISYEETDEDSCQRRLMEHQADLILTTEELKDPLFVTQQLIASPFGLLLRQPPEEMEQVSANDLSWIPLAGQSDAQTKNLCHQHGIHLRYKGYDYHRLFHLTAEGKCGLLIPKCLVPRDLEGLQWIPIQDAEPWKLYKTYPKNVEKNLMYSAALDDLHQKVFQSLGDGKEL